MRSQETFEEKNRIIFLHATYNYEMYININSYSMMTVVYAKKKLSIFQKLEMTRLRKVNNILIKHLIKSIP